MLPGFLLTIVWTYHSREREPSLALEKLRDEDVPDEVASAYAGQYCCFKLHSRYAPVSSEI